MSKIIYNHNKKLEVYLNWENKETNNLSRNCKIKEVCPLEGNCNVEYVVYHANISLKEGKFNNKT